MQGPRLVKAVIWDYGGVLIRTEDPSGRRHWERKLGLLEHELDRIVLGSEAWIRAQRGEISEDEYWNDIRLRLGLDERTIKELRYDFYKGDRVNRLATDVIACLRPKYKQAILSNNVPSLAENLCDLGISGLFDVVIISASIGVMKPTAEAYETVLEALGVKAEQAVFIDDSPENVDAAKKLGMHGVHFTAQDHNALSQLKGLLDLAR